MPSTTSVTIIMVANPGRLILISERNIEPIGNRESGIGNRRLTVAAFVLGESRAPLAHVTVSSGSGWAGPAASGSALSVTALAASGDGDLHADAEGADVADDDAVAGLEAVNDLGDGL